LVYYGGGGGGTAHTGTHGTGGLGGGGDGVGAANPNNGTDGLGGGGGGYRGVQYEGAHGGDGIVIVRYLTPTKGGRTRRDLRQFVELPGGTFIEVASPEQADELREMIAEEPVPTQEEIRKQQIQMSPELIRAVSRIRKKQVTKSVRGKSLLGSKRGLL
jgi:hypothetical protein